MNNAQSISGRCGPFDLNQVSLSHMEFLFAFIEDILFVDLAALWFYTSEPLEVIKDIFPGI